MVTEKKRPRYDVGAVKHEAQRRELEILEACGIPRESLNGRHCSCPKCGGPNDRARLFNASKGAFLCNKCGTFTDWIAVVRWMRNCDFLAAIQFAADLLGVKPVEGERKPEPPEDVLTSHARAKHVTREAFIAFGVKINESAIWFPMFDATGKECSRFTIAKPGDKGKNARGKKAGLFLPHVDGKPRLPQEGETWHVVEGVKDAAALWGLGLLAVGMPTCRLNNKFVPLLRGVHVTFVPDRDTAGDEGAQQSARKVFRSAASIKIAVLPAEMKPKDGADVRDILQQPDGEGLVRQAIENSQIWEPAHPAECEVLPQIKFGPDEARMTAEASILLAECGKVYQRGGALVEIRVNPPTPAGITRPDGGIRAVRIPRPRLRELVSATIEFVKLKQTEDGEEWVPIPPHQPIIDQLDVRGDWPGMPSLEGVVTSPMFLADGSVLAKPGYDAHSGLYLHADDCQFDGILERPTLADAERSVASLLEVVADFPIDNVGRSAWLSMVLTVSARYAINGPTPMFVFDANVRGSGKSKLADAVGRIHSGRDLPRSTFSGDDQEMRKVITASLLAGEPIVMLDNVSGPLGCASLDAVLTSTTWTDRLLGQSAMTLALLANAVWVATGNNIQFAADTPRRSLRIRIVSSLENPEERTGFRHPNLLGWVQLNRGRLAVDAVTILRAWHCAGRPDMKLPPWGSFEAWSDIIRNAIVWVGLPDPGANRQEVQLESDREATLLRQLLDAWEQADPERHGLFVTDVLAMAEVGNEPAVTNVIAELTGPSGRPSARSIGMRLHHLRGRIIDGRYFDKRDVRQGALWLVKSTDLPCTTSANSATILSPSRASSECTNSDSHTHTHTADKPEVNSGASPVSGASHACNHLDVATWKSDGKGNLRCPGCAKFMGKQVEVARASA